MPNLEKKSFIQAFREAAPYIRFFNGKIIILSISSHVVFSDTFSILAKDIALLHSFGIRVILIHGVSKYLDKKTSVHNQVVDQETLEKIKEACGKVRYNIEAALSGGMFNTSIQTGFAPIVSGNFIIAKPKGVIDGVDTQFAGLIRRINTEAIEQQLAQNQLVLISPIGYSLSGMSYALSQSEIARELGVRLQAEKIVFITRAAGIYQDGEVVNRLTAQELEQLVTKVPQHEDIQGLIKDILKSLNYGVARVQIVSGIEDGSLLFELFTRKGIGTSIAKSSFVNIRQAKNQDIPELVELTDPLIKKGILLSRQREYYEHNIKQFYVLESDDIVCGCVALNVFADKPVGEISCLAVSSEVQAFGFGELMLQYIIQLAKQRELTHLFALSTQTSDWFVERGFVESTVDELPAVRKQEYINSKRGSRVFVYSL